jgi:transcriptional regulator with XRE-family HTH domain
MPAPTSAPRISPARLRAAREQAGKSREAAATESGRSYRSICNYEYGEAKPPAEVLVNLARIYGVPVEALLD